MSETPYEPGDDGRDAGDGGNDPEILDLDSSFGDDEVDGTVFDTSYSPPERRPGATRFGTTVAEEEQGESLDQRLAQEVPDPALAEDLDGDEDDYDRVDASIPEEDELAYGEVGSERAGRLVDPNEGFGEDTDKDLIGSDVGIDEGAASAEEAAIHVIE